MAKTLKEENLRLNIIVNGDPARKEILQLTRNSRDLRAENERLRAEQKKLRTEGGANKARIEEISAAQQRDDQGQRNPGKAAPIPNETDINDDLRIESATRRTTECHAQRHTRNAPMATAAERIAGRNEPHGATSHRNCFDRRRHVPHGFSGQ